MSGHDFSRAKVPGTAFLEALADPAFVLNDDTRILYVNDSAAVAIGRQADDLVGRSLTQLVPARQHRTVQDELSRFLSEQAAPQSDPLSISLYDRDGREFPVELTLGRVAHGTGEWLLATCRNTSFHRATKQQETMNQSLLSTAQRVAKLGSWQWDLHEESLAWSHELQRIFGLEASPDAVSVDTFIDHIHPDDWDAVYAEINRAIEEHDSFEVEYRVVRPDGSVRLINGKGIAEVDASGRPVSITGTAQDVTERRAHENQAFQRALEQAARREAERTTSRFEFLANVTAALSAALTYQETIDNLIEHLIPHLADWCSLNTLAYDGTIQRPAIAHRDPEKREILETIRARDYLPHRDASHPLTRALNNPHPRLFSEIDDELMKRMARNDDHLALMRQLNPTSVMFVPLVARGRVCGILTLGMSDSGRRFDQDDLHLASEVAHRAAISIDNAQLYQEAQDAAVDREEFVSLVSHELKTPLTVIKGYMQVLERYLTQPEWQRERIQTTRERLSTQVGRLELLVSDILDVSRIQRGRLELQLESGVDLVALAEQTVSRFDDAVERRPNHSIRVIANTEIKGTWDPLRIDQAFSNLISNALKYSPSGGEITVYVTEGADSAIVNVTDEGVGISVEDQSQLFQPFQRGAASARGISGTGLGLYITRQIVEKHGGEIKVESEPGRGATFTIRLPLETPDTSRHENGYTSGSEFPPV